MLNFFKTAVLLTILLSFSLLSFSCGITDSGDCDTVQCNGITKDGDRCKNKTKNCSGYCHYHD